MQTNLQVFSVTELMLTMVPDKGNAGMKWVVVPAAVVCNKYAFSILWIDILFYMLGVLFSAGSSVALSFTFEFTIQW